MAVAERSRRVKKEAETATDRALVRAQICRINRRQLRVAHRRRLWLLATLVRGAPIGRRKAIPAGVEFPAERS